MDMEARDFAEPLGDFKWPWHGLIGQGSTPGWRVWLRRSTRSWRRSARLEDRVAGQASWCRERRGQGADSAIAALHRPFDFAFAFAVFDGVPLVVLGLAFAQRDFTFHLAVFPVQVERNQGETLLLHLANQAANLVLSAGAASWFGRHPG